jgi:DNA-binding CsgD family transcriptional regulator
MSHNSELADIFGRTTQSILKKAQKLGLKKDRDGGYLTLQQSRNSWTKTEIRELRRMYLSSSSGEIAEKLNRSRHAVQTKIKKLGLFLEFKEKGLIRKTKGGSNKWSDREIDILKKLYPQKSKEHIAKKLGRSPRAVAIKVGRLGLVTGTPGKNVWNDKDDAFLKKYIARWPIERIAKKLKRTPNAAQRRAWNKHFLKNCPNQHHTEQRLWTTQEIRKLESWFDRYSKQEIAIKLGRSLQSIIAKAKRLDLKKSSVWTSKNMAILKKYYPFESSTKVAKRLGISSALVRLKAKEIGLRKSIYAKVKRYY